MDVICDMSHPPHHIEGDVVSISHAEVAKYATAYAWMIYEMMPLDLRKQVEERGGRAALLASSVAFAMGLGVAVGFEDGTAMPEQVQIGEWLVCREHTDLWGEYKERFPAVGLHDEPDDFSAAEAWEEQREGR